jgi:tetratricopeptide (TPR) repeat protein
MNHLIGRRAAWLVIAFSCVAGVVAGQLEHLDIRFSIEKYKRATAHYNAAFKYFAEEDYARTRKELEKCVEIMPEYSQAHFFMAKNSYALGSYVAALDSMEKAEASWDIMATVAALHREQIDAERRRTRDSLQSQIDELGAQLSRNISDQQRMLIENQITELRQRIDEIDRRLMEWMERRDQMPADYCLIHGNILLRLERYNEAAAQYLQALKIDPGHSAATNNLASLLFQAGNPAKALELIEQGEANGATVNPELRKAILAALGNSDL